jgi:hypothetical protein
MNGGGALVEAVSSGMEAVAHDECSTEHSRRARWRKKEGRGRWTGAGERGMDGAARGRRPVGGWRQP